MSHQLPENLHKFELYQDKQISSTDKIGKVYFGKNLTTQKQILIQVIEKSKSIGPKDIIEKGALMLGAIQQSIALLEFHQYGENAKNCYLVYEFQQNKIGNFILGYYEWNIIQINQGFIYTAEEEEKKRKCLCYQVRKNKLSDNNQAIDIMSKEFNQKLINFNSFNLTEPYSIKIYQTIKTNLNYYSIYQFCDKNLNESLNEQTTVDLPNNLSVLFTLLKAFNELKQIKEYERQVVTLKHIFFSGKQLKVFPDIFQISSFQQNQLFLINNKNYLNFYEDLFNYIPPELGSASQEELKENNLPAKLNSSISKFQAWNFGIICYRLIFGIFPFKIIQQQIADMINSKQIDKIFLKTYFEVNVPVISQVPEPQSTQLNKLIKNCLSISPQKRITYEELFKEGIKIFSSIDLNSLSDQLSSLDLKLGAICSKPIQEQFSSNVSQETDTLQNLIKLEITEHSKKENDNAMLISQVMNNIDQHFKTQTLKSQKFGENQKAQDAMKHISMDAVGKQDINELKEELKRAIQRVKVRQKPEALYNKSKPFPVIFEQCESNFVIEITNQHECETAEFDYDLLQPYQHQINISQFIQDTIFALSKSAQYVPNAFTQYTLFRLNKLRLELLEKDLQKKENSFLEHPNPKEFFNSGEFQFARSNLTQCKAQFLEKEEVYYKQVQNSPAEQKIYEENILNAVLKTQWKAYNDIKYTIRQILYNNYYYIGNFMNSHSFQKVNTLVISVSDFKRIQLNLLFCMAIDKTFPLYFGSEYFSFDKFNDSLRNLNEQQLTNKIKAIMTTFFPNLKI